MSLERLQKVLANAGVASRRRSEEMIAQGRVTVDGEVVTQMGVKVDVSIQDVRCDGRRVRPRTCVYFLLNKPAGVICTNDDPRGRRRAIDLIPDLPSGAHTVGRLDMDTEGLVIVTNDGTLTQRVSHPRYGVPKTYRAWVRGTMATTTIRGLMAGVTLDGRRCRATQARIVSRSTEETLVELTLVEGQKREVRRMLGRLNHPVDRLMRIAIGPLLDETLATGQWRKLKKHEVDSLLHWRRRTESRRSTRRPGKGIARRGERQRNPRRTSRTRRGGKKHDAT